MNIIFALPLSFTLLIALLFITGHPGAAEKVTMVVFILLFLSIFWGLLEQRKIKGDEKCQED